MTTKTSKTREPLTAAQIMAVLPIKPRRQKLSGTYWRKLHSERTHATREALANLPQDATEKQLESFLIDVVLGNPKLEFEIVNNYLDRKRYTVTSSDNSNPILEDMQQVEALQKYFKALKSYGAPSEMKHLQDSLVRWPFDIIGAAWPIERIKSGTFMKK